MEFHRSILFVFFSLYIASSLILTFLHTIVVISKCCKKNAIAAAYSLATKNFK